MRGAALGLSPVKPKNLKHLSVALAESVAEEVGRNPSLRQHIVTLYQELANASKPAMAPRASRRTSAPKPELTPIRHVDPKLFGPDKPLDPYLVQYAYGNEQLVPVLERFPVSELKRAVAVVEQRNPGTKPTNRAQKAALISYITEYVTTGSSS